MEKQIFIFNKISNKKIFYALLIHYFAYVIMQTLALVAETKRGPSLLDRLHEWVTPRREYDWVNNQVWFILLIVSIIYLCLFRKKSAILYLLVGSMVSIFRGIFIFLTSLGPPFALNSQIPEEIIQLKLEGITFSLLLRHWLPISILWDNDSGVFFLTQDLFFSGHTASTFLLFICLDKKDWLYYAFIFFHFNTILFLIITHEHYTIDILGAYFVVYSCFMYFRKNRILNLFIKF
jgi:hypothetical protein